jgi:hypothetical protein
VEPTPPQRHAAHTPALNLDPAPSKIILSRQALRPRYSPIRV